MYRLTLTLAAAALGVVALTADEKKPAGPSYAATGAAVEPFVTGLANPESVCVGPDGRLYVTCIGAFDKDGDGTVVVVGKDDKPAVFASGLDDPKGIVYAGGSFFVTDKTKVVRIDAKGKTSVYVEAKAFPKPPKFLNDIETDGKGTLWVSDSGDNKGKGGTVFAVRSGRGGRSVSVLADDVKSPLFKSTNGLKLAAEYHLTVLDFTSGDVLRVRTTDGQTVKVAEGVVGGDGIAVDHWGRTYLTSWSKGTLHVVGKPGDAPVLVASGWKSAADLCLSADGKSLVVPDMLAGTLSRVRLGVPGAPVDESALAVKLAPAFADVKWTGWKSGAETGKVVKQRPIVLTHAGDGSNRVFLATQHGVIHAFPDNITDGATSVFLDITKKVKYSDLTNEEGFLGLAFSPKYKTNGEFYVFYTPRDENLTSRLSRFRVSKDDANKADPDSEQVLLSVKRPFWNHDGGTLCFGPDGKLYVALGDGGLANDPFGHAQNLKSLLGKILRIDVDGKGDGLGYAIPKDNPFVGRDDARGEIWAYGLRNVWRMSFDRATGKLWAADVGQNLWEEIDLIEKGGNYGWVDREGLEPFGVKGTKSDRAKGMIDPLWVYHHDFGKSVTGGHVYRGKKVPSLAGKYLYADYVSGHIRALNYDAKAGRVVGNHVVREGGFPVFSFGEDERGEVYALTETADAKGIFRFEAK